MNKARYDRFYILRYLYFIGIIALGLFTSLDPADSEGGGVAGSENLGELRYFTLDSKEVGVSYRIGLATPPGYDESGAPYPSVFTLDGAYYLQTFREGFYENDSDIIIVAVLNSDRRNIDYMPRNQCDSGGGGNKAFLKFLVRELVPYLNENYNMDPSLRILFGHSHGGSFVFYTLFADHGDNFPLLLSTDASIGCNLRYFNTLERSYHSANNRLPVVLYAAGATGQNAKFVRPYMQNLMSRDYQKLVAKYEEFHGSHDGILAEALSSGFNWLGSQIDEITKVVSEIIGTWSSGIWYHDVTASKWTEMTSSIPTGEIAAGDFTGDGKADVVSCWRDGLWYQDGATLDWTKVSGPGAVYLTAGDVTGDGRSEIIGTWSNGIWYWDVAAAKWTKMTASNPTGEITAGDFTGDGKADVASIWGNGLWYQDGDTSDWTKVSNIAPTQVTAGDVTGDGRSEIIGTWSNGIWYWDVAAAKWTKMTASNPTGEITAGDFTGDGKADVASCWSNGLWYQDGATLAWIKVSNTAPTQLTAGDVTGD
jgi:enterochelin esterase-like enzyme